MKAIGIDIINFRGSDYILSYVKPEESYIKIPDTEKLTQKNLEIIINKNPDLIVLNDNWKSIEIGTILKEKGIKIINLSTKKILKLKQKTEDIYDSKIMADYGYNLLQLHNI